MRSLPMPPRLTADALQETIESMSRRAIQQYVSEANRDYKHWEKLRYQPTPEGMKPEAAWQVVKWSRMGQYRPLPLLDERGRSFRYWLPTSAIEILHEVDRWGGATLALEPNTAPLLGAMRNQMVVSSLMEEAIATSQIEGAVTTRKVAKEMLRTNRKPRDRSEQMIVNSYRTIQLLRQRLGAPLSTNLLFEVQENMTRDTLEDPSAAGRFRAIEENIRVVDVRDSETVFVPPRADHLPQRMAELVEFANAPAEGDSFIHPLVKAAILHFWLAYEHPFVDGNGRTARALLYWYMLKSGYWLFEFLTFSRVILAAPARYYRSFLYSEQDDNDLTYSLIYQLQVTRQALANLRQYLTEKQAEQQRMVAALRKFPELNHRQRMLLNEALRDPAEIFTFLSHRNLHQITYVTARLDLLDLLRRGLLAEVRQGKQRGFVAAQDLASKLALPRQLSGLRGIGKKRKRARS